MTVEPDRLEEFIQAAIHEPNPYWPVGLTWLAKEFVALRERAARLQQLTPEQVHDLCHNLPATVPRAEFEAGCRAYQDQLYGDK